MNIAAFNLGNAAGEFIGGYVAESVYGLQGLPVAAAFFAAIGIVLLLWGEPGSVGHSAARGNARIGNQPE